MTTWLSHCHFGFATAPRHNLIKTMFGTKIKEQEIQCAVRKCTKEKERMEQRQKERKREREKVSEAVTNDGTLMMKMKTSARKSKNPISVQCALYGFTYCTGYRTLQTACTCTQSQRIDEIIRRSGVKQYDKTNLYRRQSTKIYFDFINDNFAGRRDKKKQKKENQTRMCCDLYAMHGLLMSSYKNSKLQFSHKTRVY